MPFLGPLFWGAVGLGIGLCVLPQLGQRHRHRPAKPEEFLGIENGAGAPFPPPLAIALGTAPEAALRTPVLFYLRPSVLRGPAPLAELVWVREPNANRELKNREPRAFCPATGGWRACPA